VEVIINELTSTVEVTPDDVLLDPAVIDQVARAVRARVQDDERSLAWERRERAFDRTRGHDA
jgi:hypothetical protein